MFDFLRKAIRAKRNESDAASVPDSALAASHLRLHAFVGVDTLPFEMNKGKFLIEPPAREQKIEAVGEVDLGAGAKLHRYYLSDDVWVQVNTTAGVLEEVKLWMFDDTRNPSNREDFQRWLDEGSELGRRALEYRGKSFRRVWGEEQDEWAPPVRFTEDVYTQSNALRDYSTTHHSMLFEREIDDDGRMEYLLISAELTGEEFSVVFSLGADISLADLQVT